MLDCVKTYYEKTAEINAKYQFDLSEAHRTLIGNKRGENRAAGDRAYNNRVRVLEAVRDAALASARADLAVAGDELVAWIILNCGRYPDHQKIILEALPAPIDELRRICAAQGWCGEFDTLLQQAVRAGVLDDGRTPEWHVFEQWLRNYITNRESQIGEINGHIEKIVAAALKAAKDKEKPAKKKAATEARADEQKAPEPAAEPVLVGA